MEREDAAGLALAMNPCMPVVEIQRPLHIELVVVQSGTPAAEPLWPGRRKECWAPGCLAQVLQICTENMSHLVIYQMPPYIVPGWLKGLPIGFVWVGSDTCGRPMFFVSL